MVDTEEGSRLVNVTLDLIDHQLLQCFVIVFVVVVETYRGGIKNHEHYLGPHTLIDCFNSLCSYGRNTQEVQITLYLVRSLIVSTF